MMVFHQFVMILKINLFYLVVMIVQLSCGIILLIKFYWNLMVTQIMLILFVLENMIN